MGGDFRRNRARDAMNKSPSSTLVVRKRSEKTISLKLKRGRKWGLTEFCEGEKLWEKVFWRNGKLWEGGNLGGGCGAPAAVASQCQVVANCDCRSFSSIY